MRKLTGAAVLLAFLSLAAAAVATTGPAMVATSGIVGVASNSGAVSGNLRTFAGHTFTAGGADITIGAFDLDVVSTTTDTVTLQPTLSGCVLTLASSAVVPATCETGCDWTLSLADATFNTSTGMAERVTLTLGCPVTFTVPILGCALNLLPQTTSGITLENVNSVGNNDTSATPWGSKGVISTTSLTYTTTTPCPGVTEHGTGSYAGAFAVHNLFGRL